MSEQNKSYLSTPIGDSSKTEDNDTNNTSSMPNYQSTTIKTEDYIEPKVDLHNGISIDRFLNEADLNQIKSMASQYGISLENLDFDFLSNHAGFFLSLYLKYHDVDFSTIDRQEFTIDFLDELAKSDITYQELTKLMPNIGDSIRSAMEPYQGKMVGLEFDLSDDNLENVYQHLGCLTKILKKFEKNPDLQLNNVLEVLESMQKDNISFEDITAIIPNLGDTVRNTFAPYQGQVMGLEFDLSDDSLKNVYQNISFFKELSSVLQNSDNQDVKMVALDVINLLQEEDFTYDKVEALCPNISDCMRNLLEPYENQFSVEFDLSDHNIENFYNAFIDRNENAKGEKILGALLDICPDFSKAISDSLKDRNIMVSQRAIERRLEFLFQDLNGTFSSIDEISTLFEGNFVDKVSGISKALELLDIDPITASVVVNATVATTGFDVFMDKITPENPNGWMDELVVNAADTLDSSVHRTMNAISTGAVYLHDVESDAWDTVSNWGSELVDQITFWN